MPSALCVFLTNHLGIMARNQTGQADLRTTYTVRVQISLIAVLLLLILAFNVGCSLKTDDLLEIADQPLIEIEHIEQTVQQPKLPPPIRPQVPVEVPDATELEIEPLDLNASLEIDQHLPFLSEPPPPDDQPREDLEPEPFFQVEEQPELIGGLAALQKHIQYPEIAKRANVQGKVFVQFIVDEEGRVTQPVVVRGIGAGCDEAALAAIQKAAFKPGRQRGKAVRVRMTLPVVFRLR